MDWLLPYSPNESATPTDPELPRRLLRRLVRLGKINIGSRVLDAGCGSGALTRFLDELAVDASGIDESSERISAAQSRAVHLNYACSRPSVAVPFPERHFNVVLARDLSEHRGDLFTHEALRATAHLLATVRPEGCLILVSRLEPDWSNHPGGHLQTCFMRHLECFPGLCQVSYLVDSLLDATTWKWMLGMQPRAGYLTAMLTVSQTNRSCREWEQIADQAALRHSEACCSWALESAASTRLPGHAA